MTHCEAKYIIATVGSISKLARNPLALIFLAIILYLPTWLWLGEAWWSDPYYSHGPLVLIVSLYFFWARRRLIASDASQSPLQDGRGWLGIGIVTLALVVHLWASWWHAYYISALTIPLVLLGSLLTLYGESTAKHFLFPLAFLILMVPLPLAERFGPMLEGWTATSATQVAQWIGVAATNDGSEVFLPNSSFSVGIPCGGLRSAIAIITLASLFAYIVHGSRWARAAILLAAIPVALAANTFRISLIFAIAARWGADVGLAFFDSWSGSVLFFVAFGLLIGLSYLLRCSGVRWDAILPA